MNITKEEIFDLKSEDIGTNVYRDKNLDEDGKLEDKMKDEYNSLCDTKQFKTGFAKMVINSMIKSRDYSDNKEKYNNLQNIVSKIGSDLNDNEKLEIFKIGTEFEEDGSNNKKYKVKKYPRLNVKFILDQKLNDKITVFDYIRRRLGFSHFLGNTILTTKDGKEEKIQIGSRIDIEKYNNLDNVSKIVSCTSDYSRNYGGILIFNSKMSFLKNKSNPLNRIQSKTIDESIRNQVKDIHEISYKFGSNKFAQIDSIILKYCQKERYDKYIENKRIITNRLNNFINYLFKGDTLEIDKLWNELTESILSKIKELGYKLLDTMSKIDLMKKKKLNLKN